MSTMSGCTRRASSTASAPVAASPTVDQVRCGVDEDAEAAADKGLVVGDEDADRHTQTFGEWKSRGDLEAAAGQWPGMKLAAVHGHALAHADDTEAIGGLAVVAAVAAAAVGHIQRQCSPAGRRWSPGTGQWRHV